MTQLYQMLNGTVPMAPQMQGRPAQNMFQKMGAFAQAMRSPAAFVRQCFPDIPYEIQNDPNRILNYLKQTRGITDQQVQECASNGAAMMRMFGGR